MATMEVSSAVTSILDGYTNGMDVFMRMGPRRSKKNPKIIRMTRDEFQVHDSLTRRPKEIRAEYNQSVTKHGRKFEEGDNPAYSSLAHTLFVLNAGLINLINHVLSNDVIDKPKSRQSLLELSEAAAISTMKALGQLNARLSITPQLDLVISQKREDLNPTKQSSSPEPAAVRPPPSPLLVRGGWVRTKSGSLVVPSSTTRKRENQRDTHQRSKPSPASPTLTASSTASTSSSSSNKLSKVSAEYNACSCQNPLYTFAAESAWSEMQKGITSSNLGRAPSMLLVPADYFRGEQNIKRPESPPPRPPKIPLHLRSNPSNKPRPPSTATFLTASTKLGEIPEYRWPEHTLSEEEQERIPLPYVIPPPLEAPKKKSKGFKFWRKAERKVLADTY